MDYKEAREVVHEAARKQLDEKVVAFETPDHPLYDDGGLYQDIEELRTALALCANDAEVRTLLSAIETVCKGYDGIAFDFCGLPGGDDFGQALRDTFTKLIEESK